MSTRIAFFIAGLGIAAWAPLVPYAKARAGLDEGTLGLLLLCLGVGSILAMPMAGLLATRFGCRRVVSAGVLLICAALPLLATVSSIPALIAALFMFGAGLGTVDSTVNLQAVIVERASGKTMMSGFHGLFSLGGIVGAAGVSALLGFGVSPLGATLVVIVMLLIALFKAAPHLLPYGSESSGPAFAVPHGIVLFIGGMCFIVFLAEGAALDGQRRVPGETPRDRHRLRGTGLRGVCADHDRRTFDRRCDRASSRCYAGGCIWWARRPQRACL